MFAISSGEHLASVSRMSYEFRETFANDSCDNRTSWLSFVVSSVSLSLSHWYPGSGVVLDCIDS